MEEPTEEQKKEAQAAWAKTVEHYSQNRKMRRQFKKIFGMEMPAMHLPHDNSLGYDDCPCDVCSARRVDKSVAPS